MENKVNKTEFKLEIEIGEIDGAHGMGFRALGDPHYLEEAIIATIRYDIEEPESSQKDGQNKSAILFQTIAEAYFTAITQLAHKSEYADKMQKQLSVVQTGLIETYNRLHNEIK